MRPETPNPARRAVLKRTAGFVGLAVLSAAAGNGTPASVKAAKGEFMYQDHRHDGKNCGQCKFFSPDSGNPDMGSCSIIEGTVSVEGWCLAFAPRILA